MKKENLIGFIGLGLIGGSIAKRIRKKYPAAEMIAFDKDTDSLKEAVREGVINQAYESLDPEFADCRLIFLCAPVSSNLEYLSRLKAMGIKDCLITDVGSVKEPVQAAVDQLNLEAYFMGGHPMVGSEKTGYANSTDILIENAYYFLTPSSESDFALTARFSSFIQGLGAIPVTLSPAEHDYFTAAISHVPHIMACELVHLVRRADRSNGMLKQLAAGGFKDITRIASSSPIMWKQICSINAPHIKTLLENVIQDMQEMIRQLDGRNEAYVEEYFRSAKEYRDSVPKNATGLFKKVSRIYVNIPDEPGTLATVASLLAFNGISIKNIGINHNREFEEGVLEIMFYDEETCRKSAEILEERNYQVKVR